MNCSIRWLSWVGLALLTTSTSLFAQGRNSRWVPLDAEAKPGTATRVEVLKTSREGTALRVRLAGYWVTPEVYAGRTFSRITFPEVQLGGAGFPQKEGDRGWYDFPAESGYPALDPERYRNALAVSIAKALFPEKALTAKPQTAAEMARLGIDPAGARPGIPTLRGFIGVSQATGANDLVVDVVPEGRKQLQLEAPVMPAGYEGSDQEKPTTEALGYIPLQLIDEEFYKGFKGEYRGNEKPVSEVSRAGVFSAAEVRIPLMTVLDPSTIEVWTTILVNIKHLKGTEDFECPLSWDNWLFKLPFINGEAIREALTAKGLRIEASRSAHYLIVTPREYRDELNTFALWKQSKGLNVDFAYIGNAAGDDVAPERGALDGYLEDYFKKNYCHGVYVLLVGDTDVIPTGRSTYVVASPDANDADSDHVYEVLGNDRFASLYVGRLSVNSAGELTDQLAKILAYERDPVAGDWPLNATLAANSENDDGSNGVSASHPSKYAGAVNAIATYGSYDNPPTFQRLHAGAANAATVRAVNQDVTDAIDAGRGHVLYRGHGDGVSWVAGWDGSSNYGNNWTATDIAGLNNRAFPIVYSIACQNGRIRNNESVAESWMSRAGAGAVAHWGASVNSYTSENHERAKGIFRALYESGFSRLSPALAEAERISYGATGGGGSWDNNTFCYLLLGDPELTVRKRRVFLDLNLSLAISNLASRAIHIVVTDTKGVVQPGAFVNVALKSGRSLNGFAGADGQIRFDGLTVEEVAQVDTQMDGYKPNTTVPKTPEPPVGRRWLAFDDNAKPGTPGSVNVVRSTKEGTSFGVKLPGVWLTIEQYGGRAFTRVELPAVQLGGAGFPQKEGDRGWYDFPAESGYPALDPERYRNALAVSIAKALFPEKALTAKPQTAAEMARLGIDPAGARPGIPTLRGFIGVSQATGANDLVVDVVPEGRKQLQLEAPVMPAGFEGLDQEKPTTEALGYIPPQLIDEEFYKGFKGEYRGNEKPVSEVSRAGVFSAAEVRIPLMTVLDPSTIEIWTTFLVNIKHLKGTEDFDCPLSWDNWLFKLPFINGEAIREALTAKGLRIEASRSAHYLIVTPREYRDELNTFALWKQSKGLNVDFAYIGNAAGDDVAPERGALDGYLEDYFKKNYCHGVYVLLVGDTDVIPTGRSTYVVASPDANDADSDHVYEVLGNDRFASLYVGRLSVNSAGELTDQLSKILAYERDPVAGDWPLNATLAANSENDDGSNGVSASHPSKYAGAVNAIATYGSYDNPPTFQRLHAGAANAATVRAVNQDVTDAIDAGRGHVLYRGHGDGVSWVAGWDGSSNYGNNWTATDIAGLNNRAFPIVYSIACQNGRIRNNESVAESWMSRAGAGAVAHWGASVNSYTSENHERAKGIFRALYESGFSRLSPALAEAERISYGATGGGGSWDNNTFCYLLLGDPELTVRKRRVFLDLNLSLAISNLASRAIHIVVTDTKGVVQPGAFVNVALKSGRSLNGFAGADGKIRFDGLTLEEVAQVDTQMDGYKPNTTVPKTPEPPVGRRWLAFDDNAKPGTPGTVNVVRSTKEGTSFGVKLPGVWLTTEQYAGRVFTRVELPAVQLGGAGFPQKEGDRGWYDFPAESGYPALDPERYRNALTVSIAKALFPEKALTAKPQTAAEMARLGIDPAGARPGIPTLRGFIGVSQATGANDLVVDVVPEGRKQLQLEAPVMPAGFEGLDQEKPTTEALGYIPPQLIDEEFYKGFKGEYRGNEKPVSEVSRAGVFSAAEVRIPLMTVLDPSTIEIWTTFLVNIKHLKGTEDFDCPLSWDNWLFKLPFINGEAIREALTAKGLRIEASRSAHYLIVTPREYRDELNTFALWKQSKGLNVDFAYIGNAAGDDVAPERGALDGYLEDYFKKNYCHGVYVLLVGDTDVIPTGRSTYVVASPDANDADSDHVYEVLGNDRFASLYVGRLSVNSAGELTDQLSKILAYERDPVAGDWPLNATLAANSENDDGSNGVSASHPSKYAGAVNAIATYGSYDNPPTFQRLHAGAANAATVRAVNQDVTDAIDAGRGHVLYRGHGDGVSWVAGWDGSSNYGNNWTATDIAGLNNRAFPIVYSIACQNGRIRNNESVAESWMSRAGAGAVAHWGASVNSYTSENHERAKGIFRALYESGFSRLSPALAEAERISYGATGGGGSWDNNTFCYLLLGDPELTVRKRRVFLDLNLSLAISNLASRAIHIVVTDTKGVVQPGAFVNVALKSGRSLNGFAGADGKIRFDGLTLEEVAQVDTQMDGYKPNTTVPKTPEPPVGRRWLAFDDNAKPGTPGTVNVVRSTKEGTSFGVKLPGVWLTTEQYAGRVFTRVELPAVQLGGAGFPQKEGDRGWYDFPAESGYPALDPERYRNALTVSIAKALFPEKALTAKPQTAAEMARLGIDPAGARPGIPTLRGFIGVSQATGANDLVVDVVPEGRKQLQLEAPVMPAGFEGLDQGKPVDNTAGPTTEALGYIPPQLIDEEFYKGFKGEYRGNEKPVSEVSRAGVFSAAEVRIPLMTVLDPSTIEVWTTFLVNIKHLKGTEDFECPLSWDNWLFKLPFINGEAIREALTAKGLRIEASRSAHYLIVTPREYRDELNTFALWKQSKGLNVDFAYIGNAAGDDVAPERGALDGYLEDYFKKNYCHGVYVLLVGDTDVIPTGRSTYVVASPDANDADSDHVYEVLGNDRFASLYVGRLSVNSAGELTDQLTKILAYERDPVAGDWPLNATLAANSENDDGSNGVSASHPSKYAGAVNAIATYGSYDDPPTFQRLHAGAANAATVRAVNQDVTDAIDAGRGHVLYRGHGDGVSWVAGWDGSSNYGNNWTATDIAGLNNRAFPIVYSIACQNGRIRNNESVAESWMSRAGAGAVAHWGASVNSYTSENHERAKGIFRALYESGFSRLSPALAEAERISYGATGGGGSWDNNTFCYLLLGDPELTVRKRTVRPFKINTFIDQLNSGIVIQLREGRDVPIAAALVNVVLADGRSVNGFSRSDGSLLLPSVKAGDISEISVHADGYSSDRVRISKAPLIDPKPEFNVRDGFRFKVRGDNRTYAIQVSSDLREWKTIQTFTAGEFEYVDKEALKQIRLFYRVVPVE